MSVGWPPVKSTDPIFIRRKLPPGLRNALLSAGLCVGLIVAYYAAVEKEPIAPDTRISFERRSCAGTCLLEHIVLTADGQAIVETSAGVRHVTVSKVSLRRVLLIFKQVGFLDRSVDAYSAAGADQVCQLSLSQAHRKTALRYDCQRTDAELVQPIAALRQALK